MSKVFQSDILKMFGKAIQNLEPKISESTFCCTAQKLDLLKRTGRNIGVHLGYIEVWKNADFLEICKR